MHQLRGRVALITGGGGDLGRACALELAARGSNVVITDIDAKAAEETCRLVRQIGVQCTSQTADITDLAALRSAITALQEYAGPIDILVNNAGIGGDGLMIEEITPDIFDRMFAVQVRGSFFAAQAVVPSMKARRYGRIINITSNFAMGGCSFASHYASAKSALSGLAKSWARELASWNITVNAVAPGLMATNLTRQSLGLARITAMTAEILLGRTATPAELAYAVAWIAGPEAAMLTGQVISPNGGVSIVGI